MGSTCRSLIRHGASFSTGTVGSLFRYDTSARVALLGRLSTVVTSVRSEVNVSCGGNALPGCRCAHLALTLFIGGHCKASSITFNRLSRRFVHRCVSFYLSRENLTLSAIHRCLTVLGGAYQVTFGTKRSRHCRFVRFGLPRGGRGPPGTLAHRSFLGVHSLRVPRQEGSLTLAHSLFLFTYCANATCTSAISVARRGLFHSRRNDL